jgi:hypothetical protein
VTASGGWVSRTRSHNGNLQAWWQLLEQQGCSHLCPAAPSNSVAAIPVALAALKLGGGLQCLPSGCNMFNMALQIATLDSLNKAHKVDVNQSTTCHACGACQPFTDIMEMGEQATGGIRSGCCYDQTGEAPMFCPWYAQPMGLRAPLPSCRE